MPKSKLNPNHKRFVEYRLQGASRADAYIKAYNLPEGKRDYARKAAQKLMVTNQDVTAAIDRGLEQCIKQAKEILTLEMADAADTITEIKGSGTKDDAIRLRAAEYITDRGLGKPRTDVNLEGELKSDLNIKLSLPGDLNVDDVV